jgi:Protein of unknown function (DUF1573)
MISNRGRFVAMALLFFVALATAGPAKAAARLEVDQLDFDFQSIYRGDEARHDFELTNNGDTGLQITNVRSSCGCTVPSIEKRNLAPGEKTTLTAVFNSGRFRGSVTKHIYLYSNDEKNPITKLSIHADIKQDLQVSPTSIYFAGLKSGESIQREIEIRNLSGKPVRIREIASTVSAVEVQLDKPLLEPDESALLKLSIPRVEKGMKLTGELTIFNDSHEEELKVRFYGGLIQ